MFNLTLHPRFNQMGKLFCWTTKSEIRPLNRFIFVAYCFYGLMFLSFTVRANYAPMIISPSDGYLIHLSSNSDISETPIKGTDGKNFYQVGDPIVVNGNSSSVSISGTVRCHGKTWGTSITGSPNNIFHRLFITAPPTGTLIGGKIGYRINSNVYMTVESNMISWTSFTASTCSGVTNYNVVKPATDFMSQFPFSLTFYISDRIIDGQIVIAPIDLGGYVRAFMESNVAPTQNSWPIGQTTTPMRLAASQLNVSSSCSTMNSSGQSGVIRLSHSQLNSVIYDSVATGKVSYTCKFSSLVKVRMRLDYVSDGDSQKRLPMVNTLDNTKKIYSKLRLIDESTGQSGTDLKVNIEGLKNITISSEIQGTNAAPGDYRGSAWLIATFD